MESQNALETLGNLRINPLAELLVEIAQNKLNGSLRVMNAAQKIAVYFDTGDTVFAVSNARQHRLYEMLLQAEKITREQLAAIPDYANDLALKENLIKNNLLERKEVERLFSRQISEIAKTALAWREAEWTFSPLVRIKGGIRFSVDMPNTLIEYARNLPAEEIARKFKNPLESLRVKSAIPAGVNLSPPESFVFSRFETKASAIEEIQTTSGLPEAETLRILYALWLGGLIVRKIPNAAFSERKILAMSSASLALKKDNALPAIQPAIQFTKIELTAETEAKPEEAAPVEKQISVEEYLDRVEKATNFYEFFALPPGAATAEIKQNYFGLAKRFHPDLYYKETDAKLLQRIQAAFTELAHAYDTLKSESSRNLYDFKIRKESAEIKAVQSAETTPDEIDLQKQTDQGRENFEQGFSFLMDGNHNAAVPYLARAAHFAKDNARYHAYYGKALSMDDRQRHKAETELQTAIKLDGAHANYRIMLAEFFVRFGLVKRAEGELNRLLAIYPSNGEARTLLDSLAKK